LKSREDKLDPQQAIKIQRENSRQVAEVGWKHIDLPASLIAVPQDISLVIFTPNAL